MRIKERQKLYKEQYSPACWAVMKEFGYEGPKIERAMHDEWQAQEHAELVAAAKIVNTFAEVNSDFEEHLARLPKEYAGILPTDLQWIYSHPAMSRKLRSPEDKKILLTSDDIASAPNPGVVQMLQHYVNRPDEFYKQVLDRMKKESGVVKDEESDAETFENPEDMDKIRLMIAKAAGQNE